MLELGQCDLNNGDPLARVGDVPCWSSVSGGPAASDADAPCCSSVGGRAWGSVSSLVDEEEERRSSVDGEGERRLQGKIEGGRGRKREARR